MLEIEQLFPGGTWHNEEEYVICCPEPTCQDYKINSHSHCYLNPEKGLWHCFLCGAGGKLVTFIRKYVEGEGRELKRKTAYIQKKKQYPKIALSEFSKILGKENTNDRLAFSYLKTRGCGREEIEKYDIRYAGNGRFFGRIIVPIFEDSRMVTLVGRSFIHFVKPKYLFPRTGQTVLTTSQAIFNLDGAKKAEIIVITEGVFDAIRANKLFNVSYGLSTTCAVSILSKNLSLGQLYKLLRLGKERDFYIMLDSDAFKEGVEIAKQLSKFGRSVWVVPLSSGDPASITRDEFYMAIEKELKPFSLEMEMEMKLGRLK